MQSTEIPHDKGWWAMWGKRSFDFFFSLLAIVLLSPILVVVALLVKIGSPGPAIYKGVRAGLFGKSFFILKFRTMRPDADKTGGFSTALNDPRLTGIGRFLRKYKLDELPQFLNVLKGEMSLVGPRPQVMAYTEKYSGDETSILLVRPGITDYSSIHFSNLDELLGDVDVDAKYKREIEPIKNKLRIRYVQDLSFVTDIKILVWTFLTLFGIRRQWNT